MYAVALYFSAAEIIPALIYICDREKNRAAVARHTNQM
jgi:hypothetical protein